MMMDVNDAEDRITKLEERICWIERQVEKMGQQIDHQLGLLREQMLSWQQNHDIHHADQLQQKAEARMWQRRSAGRGEHL
jgi:uncharacterized coiled-coil protein SlyX